jgi:hypothetical protein
VETPCNNGKETIYIHDNGDADCEYVMCIGDWAEVGFTADELRSLSDKTTEVINEYTASV